MLSLSQRSPINLLNCDRLLVVKRQVVGIRKDCSKRYLICCFFLHQLNPSYHCLAPRCVSFWPKQINMQLHKMLLLIYYTWQFKFKKKQSKLIFLCEIHRHRYRSHMKTFLIWSFFFKILICF